MSNVIQWKIEDNLLVVTVEDGYTLSYNTVSESSLSWTPYTDPLTPIHGTYYFKAVNGDEVKTAVLGYVGQSADSGGAINNSGTSTLENTYFLNNSATNLGGAIYNTGNMTLGNAVFSGNFAGAYGAIYNNDGCMTLSNAVFTDNSNGVLFNTSGGSMTLGNATFSRNSEGCIVNDGNMTLGSATFIENTSAIINGGSMNLTSAVFSGNSNTAIFNNVGSMRLGNALFYKNAKAFDNLCATAELENVVFSGNTQGGICNTVGSMTLNHAEFIENGAGNMHYGGAINNSDGMTLSSASFSGNSANSSGGAIYNVGSMTLSSATFNGNSAARDGGAIFNTGSMTFGSATFSGNSAQLNGGAILNISSGTMMLSNATFSGNATQYVGGAIHNGGNMTLSNATFSGNATQYDGGAIHNGGNMTLSSATFTGNVASGSSAVGGAIYNGGSATVNLTDAKFETASDTIYNNGTMTFAGTISLAGNLYTANTITASGANMIFDISSYTEGNTTEIISDISKISGANSWSVTLNADQANGTYKLAEGAENFDSSITVKVDNNSICTLSVGNIFVNGADTYRLVKDQSTLSLIVSDAVPITLTANSKSRKYDGTILTEEGYTYTGDLTTGDKLTASVTGMIQDAGTADNVVTTCQIMRGTEDVTGNYTFNDSVKGTLEVTQRNITLSSADDSKAYDGTPLTNDTINPAGDGFIGEESYVADITGSQTAVGSSKNTFTYELTNGAKKQNYNVTKIEGTLTVTSEPDELHVHDETITTSEDKEFNLVDIRNNGKLVVYNDANMTTEDLTLTDHGNLEVIYGTLTAKDITVNGTGNVISGENLNLPAKGSLTVNNGAELTLSKDLFDELSQNLYFCSDGNLIITKSSENELTQDDITNLISKNSIRGIEYQQDLTGINKLTFSQNTAMKVAFQNGYGTKQNDKITFAKNANITFGNGESVLDLQEGKNSISAEANARINLAANIRCINTFTIASGAKVSIGSAKEQGYTLFSTQDITVDENSAKFTIGSFTETVFGAVKLSNSADTVSIGNDSVFSAGAINLAGGKNTFTIGARSTIEIETLDGELNKLSIAAGTKDKAGVITETVFTVKGNVTGSGENANVISAGNYTTLDVKDIKFGSGKDKISIGSDAEFTAKEIDFGGGSNEFTIGSRSTATADAVSGVTKLTLKAGSKDKAGVITETKLTVDRNVIGNKEKANEINAGNYTTLDVKDVKFGAGKDKISIGSDAAFTAKEIDFGGESNEFTIGSRSTATTGAVSGVTKLTLKAGSKDKAGVITETKLTVDGNLIGNKEKANSISAGNYSTLDVKDVKFGSGKDKISIGSDAAFTAKEIDFGGESNEFTIGSRSTATTGAISGITKLTLKAGSKDKSTKLTADGNLTGNKEKVNSITTEKYTTLDVKDVKLGSGNDKISIGANAVFTAGEIDFNGGKDTFSTGSLSESRIGSVTNLMNFNIAAGTKDKKGLIDTTDLEILGGYTGTESADKLSIGNYADVNIHGLINMKGGNDKISVGNDSTVVLKTDDEASISLSLGKNVKAYLSSEMKSVVKKQGSNCTVADIGEADIALNFTDISDEQSDNSISREIDSDYNGWLSNLDVNALDETDWIKAGKAMTLTGDSTELTVKLNGESISFTGELKMAAGDIVQIGLAKEKNAVTYHVLANA